VRRSLGGYGDPGTSIIPPIYKALHFDPGGSARTFDISAANALLDQAGYPRGSGGIRRLKDGKPFKLRLLGRSNSPSSQQAVQNVAGWLKQIGIDVRTKIISEDSLTEIIGQGNYDLFEWGWVVEPDPNYQLSTFTCQARSYKQGGTVYANLSDSFYCNPAYDKLYTKQARQIDPAQRAETVRQMQQMLYDDAPYVVTYYYNNLEAYRSDRWTGLTPQPSPDGSLLFQYGIYSYLSVRPVTSRTGTGNGPATALLVVGGIGGAVAVAAGAGVLAARLRRRTADDVE
jgi:peptide/nickel transport system substrate-binding protein